MSRLDHCRLLRMGKPHRQVALRAGFVGNGGVTTHLVNNTVGDGGVAVVHEEADVPRGGSGARRTQSCQTGEGAEVQHGGGHAGAVVPERHAGCDAPANQNGHRLQR